MAIETKYICDRCGYESKKYENFWTVGVEVAAMPTNLGSYGRPRRYSALWCRLCCDTFALILPPPPNPASPNPSASERLETLIREIAVEAAEEHVANR